MFFEMTQTDLVNIRDRFKALNGSVDLTKKINDLEEIKIRMNAPDF